MKIALIGGDGFIGEYLTKSLYDLDNCDILVFDRNEKLTNKQDNKRVFYKGIDLENITEEFKSEINDVDYIVILTYPNEKIIKNICEMAQSSQKLKRIFYFSTMLIYKSNENNQDENSDFLPESEYEVGKVKEEKFLLDFVDSTSKNITIVRLGNVYGDTKNKGIINNFLKAILEKQPLKVNGDGNQKRDYVFVDDVAKVVNFLLFRDQENKKEIYNICTGVGLSVNNIISILESFFNKEILVEYNSECDFGKASIVGNNEKILSILPKNFQFSSLEESLKEVVKRYGFENQA